MYVLYEERGGVRTLLGLLVLVILIATMPRMWVEQADMPPPVLERPVASVPNPQPSTANQRPIEPPTVPSEEVPVVVWADLPTSHQANDLRTISQLIEEGNDQEAEAKLGTLPEAAISDPQERDYIALLWNDLGVLREKRDGTGAGVSAFETAVSLNPDNQTFRLNLTLAYWELGDPALTPDFLEETIELAPDDPWPHLVLSYILYDQDDLSGTRLHLEHATQRAGQNAALRSSIQVLTAKVKRAEQAEQGFLARESSHFMVKYNGEEDYDVWVIVLEILEEAYREVGQEFGYFPSKPITVVLHTRETFQGATGSPAWADGLFDGILGRIQVPTQGALTDQSWLTRVLRHEFVHALLHEQVGGRSGAVPQWLNEGLAMQLAGDPWPDIDHFVRGEVTLIPLNYLEGGWSRFPANIATVAYLEGNSATLYLIERYGMQKVREIVSQLATGQPIGVAIKDRLFISYREFQRRWTDHLNEKLEFGRT